jgi:hypothetical protein
MSIVAGQQRQSEKTGFCKICGEPCRGYTCSNACRQKAYRNRKFLAESEKLDIGLQQYDEQYRWN